MNETLLDYGLIEDLSIQHNKRLVSKAEEIVRQSAKNTTARYCQIIIARKYEENTYSWVDELSVTFGDVKPVANVGDFGFLYDLQKVRGKK
jgi:hypothetical protein